MSQDPVRSPTIDLAPPPQRGAGDVERAVKKWKPVFRKTRAPNFEIDQLFCIWAIPLKCRLI